ncbi:hypothetical protein LCGC14_0860960 [marine sediment metagenome]|uniref:Uncharacterized protein n=1 Tax=marine sediment metagenome TaxID=412755 RepID=A0A0F9PSX0_9ZZZZ
MYKVTGQGFMIYLINYYVDFRNDNPFGYDPYLDMKIWFSGGGNVRITISYYDSSSDVWYVTQNGYSSWIWHALDAGKTVKRIRWENLEWWFPGRVWVDIATIFYD